MEKKESIKGEKMEKNYEKILEEIDKIREYDKPSNNSKNTSEWLKTIEENKNDKKMFINSKDILNHLRNMGYIKKNDNGDGYIPTKKYFKKGLFDIGENYIYRYNKYGLKQSCTILITEKGMNVLKKDVISLIEMKKNKNSLFIKKTNS